MSQVHSKSFKSCKRLEATDLKKKVKNANYSKSLKSGLILSVPRIAKLFRKGEYSKYLGEYAPIGMAALLEYVINEIIDLTAAEVVESKKHRITPRFLFQAIKKDDELNQLL